MEEDGSIRLYERLEEMRLISKTLYEGGVIPVELGMHEANLEQYYMDLIKEEPATDQVSNKKHFRIWSR